MPEDKVDLASLDYIIDWCLQFAIPGFALKLQPFFFAVV